MIDALEEHYNSSEMKFEAQLNFQSCKCGNDESLSVFLARFIHNMNECQLVSKEPLGDQEKRDTLLRSIKNVPRRHATTYDQVSQAHTKFSDTMSYLMGKAKEESVAHTKYS